MASPQRIIHGISHVHFPLQGSDKWSTAGPTEEIYIILLWCSPHAATMETDSERLCHRKKSEIDETDFREELVSVAFSPYFSPIPSNTAVNVSLSLSLCHRHRLGSSQWDISIVEMSVTLCVSTSLMETSIMPSLDVSSTSKPPPPTVKPWGERRYAPPSGPCGFCVSFK